MLTIYQLINKTILQPYNKLCKVLEGHLYPIMTLWP